MDVCKVSAKEGMVITESCPHCNHYWVMHRYWANKIDGCLACQVEQIITKVQSNE